MKNNKPTKTKDAKKTKTINIKEYVGKAVAYINKGKVVYFIKLLDK